MQVLLSFKLLACITHCETDMTDNVTYYAVSGCLKAVIYTSRQRSSHSCTAA